MAVDIISIVVFLVIGGLAGWLASVLVTGRGFGLVGDIIIGIIGALIGGLLFGYNNSVYGFIAAFIGAVILLAVVKLIRKI